MPTALRQQKYRFGSLRKGPHWSMQGLVFYSQFRPARKLIDESLYKNHAAITGATWMGAGLNFNDSLDVVNFGDVLDMRLNDWTVEVWFTGNTTANELQGLVAKSRFAGVINRWALTFEGGNIYAQFHSTATGGVTAPITETAYIDGGLHQAVAVWDRNGNMTLHMDGSSASNSTDISGAVAEDVNSAFDFLIGSYNENDGLGPRADSNLHGTISLVRIWNRVLSTSEILELYIKPDLPMQQDPIWLMYPQAAGVTIPVMIHHYKQAGGL